MKYLFLSSLFLGLSTLSQAALTYVGGYDNFKNNTGNATELISETNPSQSLTLTGTVENTGRVHLNSSNRVSSTGSVNVGSNSGCGFMVVLSLDNLQQSETNQSLFSCILGTAATNKGYGLNFVLNTSNGVDNATLTLYIGSGVSSGAQKTLSINGLNLSGLSTLAFGYQRPGGGEHDSFFAMVNEGDLNQAYLDSDYKLGGDWYSYKFGSNQVIKSDSSGIGVTDAVDAEIVNSYFYAVGTTGDITKDNVQSYLSVAAERAPEPTTAILSVFALLGIVVRRKRVA